ncbi:Fe-only nitrogenase accessory protein AnfO [Anaerocolumna jejuensis DSM 15929]|uniref:Fe-only nitrogenase accessory protein AnfO n=1 Tax=Anaerocolumna jejuensis DSM 15929 TaxID=1121322 RepID=A0A1M6RAA3_9FIRM|nr:Fe-only nitrogenase accessory AnfO family protein [Anaerocolumna jejuensis]SHK29360.1 Fe-only nitrogenase accessory protein AnfO [Anaerocolumna jejuensis DSM 15929]
MEIAVLVNSCGNTSGFDRDGIIRVYSRIQCEWTIIRYMEFRTEKIVDSMALHAAIREICDWLKDCKVIVVERIRGIHYIAFEEKQVSMLEIPGVPEIFLEDLRECLKHQRTAKEVPLEHNAVFELRPGIYHTDLREVMKGHTSYNSKQILLPFLKNKQYSLLEIICDHVPKWLENEQTELKLRYSVETYKDCMKVKVYPSKAK